MFEHAMEDNLNQIRDLIATNVNGPLLLYAPPGAKL
jgi:hypothetical protein